MTRARSLLASLALAACTAAPPTPAGPFAWTLGAWQGHRTDAASGDRAPMTATVGAVLGGVGTCEELSITSGDRHYRGVTLQVFDPALDRWVRQYVNDVRGRFVRLEGAVDGDGRSSTWEVVAPDRARRSRLTSERVGERGWTRTMRVSEDDGATWRELWRDELVRR